ncbi:DNA-directed RNA polymerase subunit H [Candidatus Pacearchaeota archaeon]|nr:DNA-directed RNA polymerase subunit H [Candidatus Pacearchaeota archaeon]
MHILQPRHIRLKKEEAEELLKRLNISVSQLPKIFITDTALPEGCQKGDVVRMERKYEDKIYPYYRVVVGSLNEKKNG